METENLMNATKKDLKKFYEEAGEKYPEEEEVYRTLRGILRKRFILSFLNRFQGSLLDIGANRGMYLDEYRNGGRTGIDLSLNVLKKAKPTPAKQLLVADAENLFCFRPAVFDNVLCSEVLEHCLHPEQVFSSIAHVLKSGGLGLLTTPNYRGRRPDWIGLGNLDMYDVHCGCDTYYHTAYRPEELEKYAKEAGLEVIEAGTLEKEVKYAAKLPKLMYILLQTINRIFQSKKLFRFNDRLFQRSSMLIYYLCHDTGIDKILLPWIQEGVRSFILVRKP